MVRTTVTDRVKTVVDPQNANRSSTDLERASASRRKVLQPVDDIAIQSIGCHLTGSRAGRQKTPEDYQHALAAAESCQRLAALYADRRNPNEDNQS
jgi:hypothetical protein